MDDRERGATVLVWKCEPSKTERFHTLASQTCLLQEKFLVRLEICVQQNNSIELNIDEGWYSEDELCTVLKWSERLCLYSIAGKTAIRIIQLGSVQWIIFSRS